MKRTLLVLFICALTISASRAQYVWLSDRETSPDGTRHPWQHGDTLRGLVRSNDTIAIMEDPAFYRNVMTTAPDFWRGPIYNPQFLGPQPQFNVARMPIPLQSADNLRNCAAEQGNFYNFPGQMFRAYFTDSYVHMYKWERGTAFSSRDNWFIPIMPGGPAAVGTCIFVLGPLEILGDTTNNGAFTGKVTIGASGNIRILDNLRYALSSWPSGVVMDPNSHNLLGVVSEANILIGNTIANGRRNSGMPNDTSGDLQTDLRRTGITLTGIFVSINGSFTFEQQNDPNEGYVCDCHPDDRGTLYLYGAIWQKQRGFLHRPTNQSTGYLVDLSYDYRLGQYMPPGFYRDWPRDQNTDSLDFGDVAVGATETDTAYFFAMSPGNIGLVMATYPFYAVNPQPMYNDHWVIPVRFTPPRVGRFVGYLSVSLPGQFLQIPLIGHGVAAAAPPIVMDVAPNPFNSAALLRYDLTEAAAVGIVVYNLLGRVIQEVHFDQQPAGSHLVRLDGERWASGVYFATLHVNNQTVTRKLLLLK